jgi:hypothetical protein
MRSSYVHRAVVDLPGDGDVAALGGAVSASLCGSWEHDGPCPLAPHHTAVEQEGTRTTLRVLFATEPGNEARVRGLIGTALGAGSVRGPDGRTTTWALVEHGADEILPAEVMHAFRLATSPA